MIREFVKKISWLGHDGFIIDGSKVLCIDPYQVASAKKADIILITHEHYDHCSPGDIEKVRTPGSVIVTEKDSAKKLSGDVRVMAPGDSLEVGEVKIRAVPAYNIGKQFHPKAKGWLGFIIEMDGVKVYHTGDSDFIPEMEEIKADIALLPVSGTYVMDADEAVRAALAIKPELAIPMHYGAIVGDETDAERFSKALKGKIDVAVLKKT